MTRPLITICQNSETPHITMPSEMTPITNAPIIVPPIVPIPPAIDVPPKTAAAIAFISHVSPEAGCAASSCAVVISPTIVAQIAEKI